MGLNIGKRATLLRTESVIRTHLQYSTAGPFTLWVETYLQGPILDHLTRP